MECLVEFLRKPRWYSEDVDRVDKSPFQWRACDNDCGYVLSLLGVINGVLPKLGTCLVVVDGYGRVRLTFKKPWW